MVVFDDVEVALLDLDGTVYVGSRPVPGAGEAVERLRRDGLAVRFTSNTDSTSPAALAARLAGMGIPAAEDDFLTPVVLARRLFDDLPAARVLAIASPAVREHLPRLQDLGGPGGRPTHVLLCDPSYGATYDDLTPPSGPSATAPSWWPPSSGASPGATTASTWTPAGGCACSSTPPACVPASSASRRRSSSAWHSSWSAARPT